MDSRSTIHDNKLIAFFNGEVLVVQTYINLDDPCKILLNVTPSIILLNLNLSTYLR